jgi:hypothetical protein
MLLAWVDSKVASWIPKVDFTVFVKNPPRGQIMSRNQLLLNNLIYSAYRSGFYLDSPVKNPVASEMPRCAPPHTNGTGEEPCQGGSAIIILF